MNHLEPLSNPAQTKSMLLVEPKKAGRSFREIINGVESDFTTIGNNLNIMKPVTQAFVPSFPAWTNTGSLSTIVKDKSPQESAERKQMQLELETIRARADAAEAQLLRERKKVEEAIEKKRQQEIEKQALKLQEEQRILKEQQEQEQKRLEIEKIRNEILRREEQERIRKEQERIELEKEEKRKRELQIERLRREAEAAEAAKKMQLRREKLAALVEAIKRRRALRIKRFIKEKLTPNILHARGCIEKRNKQALKRSRLWHFNLCVSTINPYSSLSVSKLRPLHSTPEGIRERVRKCMLAEKYALEDVKQVISCASC